MTTQYGKGGQGGAPAGYGNVPREPSAGTVSRPVAGLGKLPPGWHDLECLSLATYPTHSVVILANPAGHVHTECVLRPLPTWLRVGIRARGRVGPGPGFVVVRDVDRFQARDSVSKVPVTDWHTDLSQLYAAATAAGARPASTELKEVVLADDTWVPKLHQVGTPARQAGEPERPAPEADR